MAKVSLRIYNREIETLIDQGQIDEAVGHCHHILKTFPKHLETYRLLGKAYLEARRYNDAGDIFSRVLMSVPNDFVSHAGMSVIADEREKLNEAIWHMQRAFEAQPSNAAVQGELQRLYGRRDGVEPPKIRMTSGALANVYVQGELYAQAIAEIMSVEAQDPGRMDMQVLLADAYFRSGQRVEASQMASKLLEKSPYCYDANRILVEILPETSRSESTQVYRHRVNALDPYAAFTKGSIFNTDDVADAAINLERLDWQPGSAPQLSSGWEDSAAIELDDEKQPDWLKEDEDARDLEPASAMETSSEEEGIPDFMRAAGWGNSSGEEETSFFDSPDSESESTSDVEEIEQAEMPDWMKTTAPSDAELAVADVLENNEENKTGDDMASDEWINDLLDDDDNEDEEKKPAESPKTDAGIDENLIGSLGTSEDDQDAAMNWLESLAANQGAKPEELITDPNARTEAAPDWVDQAKEASEKTPEVEEPAAEVADDIPDWLEDMKEEAPEVEETPVAEEETLISDSAIGELGASADDQDAAMNWLESLAANQGAKPEELITDPNARTEAAPEWVEQAKESSEKVPEAENSDDLEEVVEEEKEETVAEALDDTPAWLKDIDDEPAPEAVDETQERLQDEVEASVEAVPAVPEAEEEPAISEIDEAEQVEEIPEMPDLAAFATDEIEIPQPESEPPAEFAQEEEKTEDDAPTWIKAMEESSGESIPPAAEAMPPAEDDLPGWLSDLDGSESEEETKEDEPLPDWMKSEESSDPEPTQASEWQPVDETETPLAQPESKPEPVVEVVPEPAPVEEEKEKTFADVSDQLAKEDVLPRKDDVPPPQEVVEKEEVAPVQPEEKKEKSIRKMDTTALRDTALMSAQAAMREGNVADALVEYGKMVKKKRLLDEIIYDLREALDDYPIDISVWQMLGDAYMRAGRLQEAIDAYTNAEKLLR